MLIFVTLFTLLRFSEVQAAPNQCEGLFNGTSFWTQTYSGKLETLANLTEANALSFIETHGTYRNINFENNTLDGTPLRKLFAVGSQNFGVYKIRGSNGILKIHKLQDKPATITLPDSQSAILFTKRVSGNYIGALSNGPLLIEFGILVDQKGRKYFFTVIQELHVGELATTLKDNAENYEHDFAHSRNLMNKFFKQNPNAILKLSGDVLNKLEQGIHMNDPDFSISASGKVKWIDTDFWKMVVRTPDTLTNQANVLYVIITMLKKANNNLALSFSTQLQILIQNSIALNTYEKDYYRTMLVTFEREIRKKEAISY